MLARQLEERTVVQGDQQRGRDRPGARDLEVTATPGGDDGNWTLVELRHTLTPRRPIPADAPAHHLTDIAIHAIAGEWGFAQR